MRVDSPPAMAYTIPARRSAACLALALYGATLERFTRLGMRIRPEPCRESRKALSFFKGTA